MRKTLTSAVALSFAFGLPALAQDTSIDSDKREQLEAAGFSNPRMVSDVEVARVTDDEGNTYYVLSGLGGGGMGGAGHTMDQAGGGAAGAGTDQTAAAGAGAAGATGGGAAPEPGGAQSEQAIEAQAGQSETAEIGVGGQVPDPNIDMAAPEVDSEPVEGEMADADDADTDELATAGGAQAGAGGDTATAGAQPQPGAGGDTATAGAQPQAGAGGDTATAGLGGDAGGQSLEDRLSEAGIENYELVDDAEVAEVTMDGGQPVYVIIGIGETDGDS